MPDLTQSWPGKIYRAVYSTLCGRTPYERPWHFQWLSTFALHRRLLRQLPDYGGRVLDVGCGAKPYRSWFRDVREYVGIDVSPGEDVDVVIGPCEQWPLPDHYYDVVIATQVVEHVERLDFTLGEMMRVLKPGGVIILSFPFLYNVHGAPNDFRRLTHLGAAKLLPDCDTILLETQGGIGSTLVILFLNWVETALSGSPLRGMIKGLLLPLFIPLSLLLNLLGLALDCLDRTTAYYSNVLLIASKQGVPGLLR